MKNIVLVGFMGSGKTEIAKALAHDTGKEYVSVDNLIEIREDKLISDIFRDEGEEYFRTVEREVVKEVSAKLDQVIDTGGGVVLNRQNMKDLRRTGVVICLWADVDAIYDRTKEYAHRPLLEVDDPRKMIRELLEYRRPYYKKANYHIDTTGLDLTIVLDRVKNIMRNRLEGRQGRGRGLEENTVLWGYFSERLLQNIKYPVMLVDNEGQVVFVNKKYLTAFSLLENDIMNRSWINGIIPESARGDAWKINKEMKRKNRLFKFDMPVVASGVSGKYISWLVVPIKEEKTVFYMFVGREKEDPVDSSAKSHTLSSKELHAAHLEMMGILFDAGMRSEPWVAEHSARVKTFAASLAKKIKLSKVKTERLKVAALLHDIGKLGVEESILFKKEQLTKNEFRQMKMHSYWGAEMARLIYFLRKTIPIIVNHHENFDGSGYPKGRKGWRIPLEARILSIADIYEALTADRPYREKFSIDEAVAIMENEKGHKIDPRLTDIFLDMVRKGVF